LKRFVMKTLCCFGVMSIVVLGASDLLARDTDAMQNFWQQNVRKLHFDLHTQADETELGNNFDPVDFADKMKRSGTQAVVFFCRGGRGHAYHPSKFNSPHPHLKSDMFGDPSKELDQRGLGVIAYFHCVPLCKPDAEKHPDWLAQDRGGSAKYNAEKKRHSVCPASRFWEESFIPQMLEVDRLYPVGAFWVDGVYHWFSNPCFCERCRGLFGRPVPEANDPDWRHYNHFVRELVWEKLNLCAKALHDQNPALVFGSNWVGSPMWAYPAPDGFDFNTGDIRFDNGALNAAFAFACWTWRGKPADVNMQREYWWQEFNTRSIYDLHREFAATLASGGTFMLGDTLRPYDCRVEEEKVRFYRDAFNGTAKMEPVVAGAKPYADVALLFSPEQLRALRRTWGLWSPSVTKTDPHYGVYSVIAEAGFTSHVLFDADVKKHVSRYKALIIPELNTIGSVAAQAIKAYVQNGGSLVLIGSVPVVMDAHVTWTKEAAADRSFFEEMAGIQVAGQFDYEKTFFHPADFKDDSLWREDVYKLPVGVWGKATKAILNGAGMIAPIAAPGRMVQGGIPMGQRLENPAFSVNHYGKGRVYFVAQPLGSEYWEHGWRGVGCALQGLLQQAAGQLYAQRKGGSMVQLFVTEKKNETALHLVAYLNDIRTNPRNQLSEPVTISGPVVIVHSDKKVKSIQSTNSGLNVQYQRQGDELTIKVPPFEIWESLVVQWK